MTKTSLSSIVQHQDKKHADDNLLKKNDLASRLGCSLRQIELMVKSGRLPRPFYLGDASPRWRRCDVDAWLERLATDAQSSEVSR